MSLPPQVPYQSEMNLWEECNGLGNCTVFDATTAQCSCDGCLLKPGVNVTDPGPKCINCLPRPTCQAGQCSFKARQFVGFQGRLETWGGLMYDSTSVFDADRMSGQRFFTPATSFDVGNIGSTMLPLLQISCAGELAVTLANSMLSGGVHAPFLQDMVAFLASWNRALQTCRLKGVNPVASPLTATQLDMRFHPHHMAFWLYQYTAFGAATLNDLAAGACAAAGGRQGWQGPLNAVSPPPGVYPCVPRRFLRAIRADGHAVERVGQARALPHAFSHLHLPRRHALGIQLPHERRRVLSPL
jgi:hypothetical protein